MSFILYVQIFKFDFCKITNYTRYECLSLFECGQNMIDYNKNYNLKNVMYNRNRR